MEGQGCTAEVMACAQTVDGAGGRDRWWARAEAGRVRRCLHRLAETRFWTTSLDSPRPFTPPLHSPPFAPSKTMSAPPHPISPPPTAAAAPASTGVRRHHTITATSRSARAGSRPPISEESHEQQTWNDDEVVDQDWVGAVGAVGEKGSLHRQASLPTRYNRGTLFPTSPSFPTSVPLSSRILTHSITNLSDRHRMLSQHTGKDPDKVEP